MGKLDKGETFPAAAVREVAEETGYRVRLHRPLPAAVYLLPDGRTKIVQFWTATVRSKTGPGPRSEEHTSELQSRGPRVCRRMLEKKKREKSMSREENTVGTGDT